MMILFLAGCTPWYKNYGIHGEADLKSPKSYPLLLRAVKDGRCKAVAPLVALSANHHDESVKALINLLGRCINWDNFDENTSSVVADGLGVLGTEADVIPVLNIASLESEDLIHRLDALSALGSMGQKSSPFSSRIVLFLTDKEPSIRTHTLNTLFKIGPKSELIVKGLLIMLSDQSPAIRATAAASLPRLHQAGPEVMAALDVALRDKDSTTREEAVKSSNQLKLMVAAGQADTRSLNSIEGSHQASVAASSVNHRVDVTPTPRMNFVTENAPSFALGSPQRNAYAFIIGIENYRDVPSAKSARVDAQRFASLAKATLAIPEDHIRLALDDHATRSDIEKGIDWFKKNVPAGGRLYFFFSGHGAPDPSTGASYLIPFDGDARQLEQTAIPMSVLMRSLSASKAKDVLVLVDSCFSGAGGRSILPPGTRPLVHLKEAQPSPRIAIISASTGAEVSGELPGGSGGLFTQTLLEALGRGVADQDGDGNISLQELFDWVRPRVVRKAQQDSREQTPRLILGGKFGKSQDFFIASGIASR